MEQRPEDRVGEAVVVALGHLVTEVHGDARELGREAFRDVGPIDLGDVEAWRGQRGWQGARSYRASRSR